MSTYLPGTLIHGEFRIVGLSCAADAIALERRLANLSGVIEAVVNPVTEAAYLTFDGQRVSARAIRDTIQASGYLAG